MTRTPARLVPALVAIFLVANVGVLAQIARLTGRVKNPEGRGVPGAVVVAENPQGAPDSFRVSTDDDGYFAMIGLRPGVWTVTVVAAGYEPMRTALRVSASRTMTPLDVRLEKRVLPLSAFGDLPIAELQSRLDRADARFASGDAAGALADYRALLEEVPALTSLTLQIGRACRALGDVAGARAAFEAAADGDAGEETALLELTELEAGLGNAEAARRHASRLAQLAPDSPEAARARELAGDPPR